MRQVEATEILTLEDAREIDGLVKMSGILLKVALYVIWVGRGHEAFGLPSFEAYCQVRHGLQYRTVYNWLGIVAASMKREGVTMAQLQQMVLTRQGNLKLVTSIEADRINGTRRTGSAYRNGSTAYASLKARYEALESENKQLREQVKRLQVALAVTL